MMMLVFALGMMQSGSVDGKGPSVGMMFEYAKKKQHKELEALGSEIRGSKDKNLNYAYSVALYLADSKGNKEKFVSGFPTDYAGLMFLFEEVELKKFTPRFMYSFESLAKIAESDKK